MVGLHFLKKENKSQLEPDRISYSYLGGKLNIFRSKIDICVKFWLPRKYQKVMAGHCTCTAMQGVTVHCKTQTASYMFQLGRDEQRSNEVTNTAAGNAAVLCMCYIKFSRSGVFGQFVKHSRASTSKQAMKLTSPPLSPFMPKSHKCSRVNPMRHDHPLPKRTRNHKILGKLAVSTKSVHDVEEILQKS